VLRVKERDFGEGNNAGAWKLTAPGWAVALEPGKLAVLVFAEGETNENSRTMTELASLLR
jgi:hypothetical protein